MTDANDAEPDPLAPPASRNRRLLLIIAAGALAVATATIWFVAALSGPGSESSDSAASRSQTGTDLTPLLERRYSDQELGIESVIDEYFQVMTPVDTRFRSASERRDYRAERNRYFNHEAIGHERERLHFERNLMLALDAAYDELPSDLGFDGLLDQAFEDAMLECAASEGWPDLQLVSASESNVSRSTELYGITREQFRELRHECAKVAATYPTLDPAARDELLGRLKEHYRAAVHEYLREFPDAEVPLVDHPGAPRPLEERLIKTCLKTPDPAQCAVEFRVELPAQ